MKTAIVIDNFQNFTVSLMRMVMNTLVSSTPDCGVINFYKTNKLKNILPPGTETLDFEYDIDGENYLELSKRAEKFVSENGIENFYIVHFPLRKNLNLSFNSSMLTTFIDKFDKEHDYEYGMKGFMNRKIYKLFAFLKGLHSLNARHIVLDPQEVDFGNYLPFKAYSRHCILKNARCRYLPLYECSLGLCMAPAKKEHDFFFIGSVYSDDRKYLYDLEKQVTNTEDFIFKVIDSKENKENVLSQDDYYKEIGKTKYTLVIPSYDKTSFSIIRFFESIYGDCVPLILDLCCTKDFETTFPEIFELVKKHNLIVTISELNARSKHYDEDKKFIEEVKNTRTWKAISDKDYVKKIYNKVFGDK